MPAYKLAASSAVNTVPSANWKSLNAIAVLFAAVLFHPLPIKSVRLTLFAGLRDADRARMPFM